MVIRSKVMSDLSLYLTSMGVLLHCVRASAVVLTRCDEVTGVALVHNLKFKTPVTSIFIKIF